MNNYRRQEPVWRCAVAGGPKGFRAVLLAAVFGMLLPGTIAAAGVGEPGQTQPAATKPAPAAPSATQSVPASPSGVKPAPSAVQMESWHRTLLKKPAPKRGCFTATYPETTWREVPCKAPPHKLYPPRRPGAVRSLVVGGTGPNFSAVVTGHILQSEGSFDSVANLTAECQAECSGGSCSTNQTCTPSSPTNEYSLQLNSKPFATSACKDSPNPDTCQGWEQFVYAQDSYSPSDTGSAFIQYWLLKYGPPGTACPDPQGTSCTQNHVGTDGWCPFQFQPTDPVYCVVNGPFSASPPSVPITSMAQQKLAGTAGRGIATPDSITVWEGNTNYEAVGGNYFPDLSSQWQAAEFNVFGNANSSQAVFNNGATLAVRDGVTDGTTNGPSCDAHTYTGESNNLTLIDSAPAAINGPMPALLFSEAIPTAGGLATCADATSVGDTHVTTFNGLHCDFQASGDFVLLEAPDFTVHARQASGAPSYPNAAMNKAIVTQMGTTRVEIYLQPTRILIDGKQTDLADGKTVLLPTGVQVTRRGNIYDISSESGNAVRATVNSAWIDTIVGLGQTPTAQVRGLLGNPGANARQLVTAAGAVLQQPVSFNDLYYKYGESWRVPTAKSLFTVTAVVPAGSAGKLLFGPKRPVEPSNPTKPLYAPDLDPAGSSHAMKVCKAAGVVDPALLDDCVLDVTVLKDDKAAETYRTSRVPTGVFRPVMTSKPTAQ